MIAIMNNEAERLKCLVAYAIPSVFEISKGKNHVSFGGP